MLQIERRRAERKRASQLSLLSPEERKRQLASELKTALDHAKGAKVSGNMEQQRVAGNVIRQLKLEIASNAFKEADIHALMAHQGVSTKPESGAWLPDALEEYCFPDRLSLLNGPLGSGRARSCLALTLRDSAHQGTGSRQAR